MTITYHPDLIQGSEEWHAARCGLITASEMKLILTPTMKVANNDKTRAHVWELAAQRITGYVEPTYIGEAMLRGHEDEVLARALYAEHFAPVEEVGFVTNDEWGFTLGCSPDGLVGDDGMIECKSRIQKYQVQTIVEHYRAATIPEDFVLQVQTALLVTGRKWCDLISYSGGLPMTAMRCAANPEMQAAILDACQAFEAKIAEAMADYHAALSADKTLIPTERRVEEEMFV
jgi:predicted phage-related endonuclease